MTLRYPVATTEFEFTVLDKNTWLIMDEARGWQHHFRAKRIKYALLTSAYSRANAISESRENVDTFQLYHEMDLVPTCTSAPFEIRPTRSNNVVKSQVKTHDGF